MGGGSRGGGGPSSHVRMHVTFPRLTNSHHCLIFPQTEMCNMPNPDQTKGTIVGKTEIYKKENLVGPLLVHNLLVPDPPPPPTTRLFF